MIKVIAIQLLKNNRGQLIIFISAMLLFLKELPNLISYVWYFIALLMLYFIYNDLKFYVYYYDTWEFIEKILLLTKIETENSDFEKFQINYNNLRKNIKKRLRSSRGNLLTYDYEINRIIQDIDTFFDATIKILFRRKIMTIPFSPHDAYEIILEETDKQSQLHHFMDEDIESPPIEYDFEYRKINQIDFYAINKFLKYFGDINIRKQKIKFVNTVAIGELFRRWNLIIEKLERNIFEESKNDVEKYYDKKREKKGLILKMLFELLVLFMLTILSGIIIELFRKVI